MYTPNPNPFADEFDAHIAVEQGFLTALVRTLGVPPADASDVVQSANVYLVENRAKYQPGSNFRAWAAQIVRYRCLIYFRERHRRPMISLSEEMADLITTEFVAQFDETEEQLKRLKHCLSKLPEEHSELIAAVYGAGCSLKEYALRARQSHAAVRKTISRIRHALRSCIERMADDFEGPK